MRRTLLPAAVAAVAILSTSCDDAAGPRRRVPGAIAIAPNFASLNLDVVAIAKGRFLLTRIPGGEVALDTVITITPGQDSVDLALTVPILTPGEQFSLFISLLSSANDTLFQAGPLTVVPSTSGTPVPVPADFVYVGTGADAAGVRIVTPDTSVFFGEAVTLIGEAFDSAAVTIPATPIGWASLDTLVAQVTTDPSYHGIVTGGSQRGTARLVATLITGQTDTVLVKAQPVPSAILAESGNNQTARADSLLAQPLVARVLGADALGIAGVWVRFGLKAGNGTLSIDSVRTGTDGRAAAQYTMARSFAPHVIAATTPRLPTDTATFTAQLQSEPPASIAIAAGDGQTATAAQAVTVAPQVRLLDANAQAVAGATVTFSVTGGAGVVAGGTPVTDTLGLAAVTSWTLGTTAGPNALRAVVVEGLDTLEVTFSATGVAGAATQLVLVSGDAQTDTVGATLSAPLIVRAEDANDNPVAGATVDWSAAAGSVSGATTPTDTAGLTQVTWTLGMTAGAQAATATVDGTTATVGFTAVATPGTAARLGFTVEPTNVRADSVIMPAVAVTAYDGFDNVATGFTDGVQVALLANPAAGMLSGTTTAAAVAGVVTFADLRVDQFGSGYTLLASGSGLTPDTSAAFDVLPPAGAAYWANASGGNWSDPTNWLGGALPTTTDTVIVDLAGSYTITLDTTVTVARLLLGDGSNAPILTYASRSFGTSDGVVVASGATMQLATGTFDGPGTVTVASGATLVSDRSTVNADLVNQGTVELQGNPQALNGALTQTGTLRLTSDAFGNGGLLTVASGFTNNGAIELTGTNEARITVTSGTLTNAASGTITTLGTYQRTLSTPVDNQGVIDIQGSGGLVLNAASAQHTNGGTITLAGGNLTLTQSGTTPSFTTTGSVTVGAGQTLAVNGGSFVHQAGTLAGTGTIALSAATGAFTPDFTVDTLGLTLSNATVNGPGTVTVASGATLVSVHSTINADVINQGTLELQAYPQFLNGALTQTGTMRVTSDGFGNGGLLTVASGFTNSGAIELTGTNEARITVTSGTLTNAASGTITTLGTYVRTLATPVDNQGAMDIQGSGGLVLNAASAQHTNSGTITLSGGDLTVTQSGTTPSFTHSAGTIEIGAAQTLAVTGGAFAFSGGTLQGDGTADLTGATVTTLDGAFAPGTSPGLLTLDLPASVALGTNAAVTIELGADPSANPPGVDNDLLRATNQLLALGGTLDVTLINGYVPAGTETWPLLAGVSGSFAQVNLPPLDYSWITYLQNDTLYLGPPPAAGPPGTEATWQGQVDTNWGTASNWDTGVVPDDTTNVFIPAGTPSAPTVSGTATVDSLVVEDGAALTLGSGATLTASGSVSAGTSIVGGGTLVVMGDGNTVSGTISNLSTTDSINVDGPLTITGNLTAGGSSGNANALVLNGFPVTVGGNLVFGPSGYGGVRMGPGDTLTVAGSANFSGGFTDTRLVGGVLRVAGNITSASGGYDPTGTHKLILDGTGAQTISLVSPATYTLQDVEVANTAGSVTFVTDAVIDGVLTTQPGAIPIVGGSATLTVRGDLDPATTIAGAGTVRKEYAGTTLGGVYPNLETVDSITLSGPLIVTGTLTVTGPNSPTSPAGPNVLVLNGFVASVTGDLVVGPAYGGVRMLDGDTLAVTGNASFAGGNTTDRLGGGVLIVGGDFTQFNTPDAYAPMGTHTLILNGTAGQTISLANPTSSVFQNLEIVNLLGGVTLASAVQANGQLIVPGTGVALHGDGYALSVAGLDVDGLTLDSLPLTSTGGTITRFDNVTFDAYAPTTTQLTILHPGAAAPFTFDGLAFNTVPTSGAYISATDNLTDANTLTIDLTNSTPSDGSASTNTAGGAVVNWVQPAPPNLNAWTGGAGDGLWTSAGNWSKNAVPVAGDSVVIDLAGTYTITIPSPEAPQVSQLVLGGTGATPTLEIAGFATLVVDDTASVAAGATLQMDDASRFDGAAVLSIEGTLTCPAGNCNMTGAGLTEIASGGTLVIDGAGGVGLNLDTRNLVNRGTTNWQGGSSISAAGGASVLNAPGGVFNVSTTSGATAPIVNQGSFIRTGNAFATSMAADFATTGTVDVQQGVLSFASIPASGTWAGTVTVAPSAQLNLDAGSYTWNDGLTMTGPVLLSGPNAITIPGGATVTLDQINMTGGTLQVDGVADVNGSFTKGGSAILQGTGTLDLADPVIPAFDGPINPGTSPGLLTIVTPAGGLPLESTASVNIELAGTTRGTQYDVLEVAGGLVLNGNATLNVATTSFTPTVGDRFAVMTFTSRSGTFGAVTFPSVAGVQFDTVWTSGRTPDTLYVEAATVGPGVNQWQNAAGGLWSDDASWSLGRAPLAGDTVEILTAGTYTVTLDVDASVDSIALGGASGTQTLDATGTRTLTMAKNGSVNASGALDLQSGDLTLAGGNVLTVNGGVLHVATGRTLTLGTGDVSEITYLGGTIGGPGTLALTTDAQFNVRADLTLDSLSVLVFDGAINTGGAQRLTIGPDALLNMASNLGVNINLPVINQGALIGTGTQVYLNDSLYNEAGALLILDGTGGQAVLTANGIDNSGTINLSGTTQVTLQVTGPGGLTNRVTGVVATQAGATRIINATLINEGGTVGIGAPTQITRASAQHVNTGAIDITAGNLFFVQSGTSPSLTNQASIVVGPATTLTVSGGTFTNDVAGTLNGSGTVNVSATAFTNAGTLAPGLSPGLLTWQGNIGMAATAQLPIELGGTTVGTEYDRLSASGYTLTLDGELNVSLINAFTPVVGDSFTVLTYGARSGDFNSVILPSVSGLVLDTGSTATSFYVVAHPIPQPILFAGDSASTTTNSGIFKVDGDGTNQIQITTEGPPAELNVHPRWSPDRARVTYSARQPGDPNQLHIRSADGQQVWHLTSVSDTSTFKPRYSPDGKHLAFECGDGGYPNSAQDVCVISDVTNPADGMGDGSGKVYVTDAVSATLGGSGAFAWNPTNPDQLAVVRDSAGAAVGSQIWLVNYDGSGATPLGASRIKDGAGALVQVYAMDWSPDGTFIAFEATSGSTRSIFRIEVASGVVTQLTTQNLDHTPVISPDNQTILFGRETDLWTLMQIPAVGGSVVQMSSTMNFGLDQAGWDWSPDGTEIVVTEDITTGGVVISKIFPTTTATSFFSDAKQVGRRRGIEIQDRQPSWRP